jgi:hypothetical protein
MWLMTLDAHNPELVHAIYDVEALELSPNPQYHDILNPLFVWEPPVTIKPNFLVTTQNDRDRNSGTLQQ